MKLCSACKTLLSLAAFNKKALAKNGLRPECQQCQQQSNRRYRKDPKQRTDELSKNRLRRKHYETNEPEKCRAWEISTNHRRKERYAKDVQYRKRVISNVLAWTQKHLDMSNAWKASRRAQKLNATPKWLTKQQKDWVKEWYTTAKWCETNFGGKWHVDHIIPLKGKNVSGLHVPWNLQVLPAAENIAKGNRT